MNNKTHKVVCRAILLLVAILCMFSAIKVYKYYNQKPEMTNTEASAIDQKKPEQKTEYKAKYKAKKVEFKAKDKDALYYEDMVTFEAERAFDYCTTPEVSIDENKKTVSCHFRFKNKVPRSDDNYVYVFELAPYEDENIGADKNPVAVVKKAKEIGIKVPFENKRLFSRFCPSILVNGEYVALSKGQNIKNPEILAKDLKDYPFELTKKGLLLDANTIDKEELYDLNVKRVIYNIPLSYVIGESDSPALPTIEYEYNGKTYYFNTYMLAGFDYMFKNLTDNGFHITAIVLNDWNKENSEIIHPLSRKRTRRSLYYAFNTEEKEGTELLEATAMFLADRYTGDEYGMVYDWVIANEVNQHKIWNYMATDDLDYYTDSFERGFRVFYNAIKANYAGANVYFSIDHDWNDNGGNNSRFFNGRDFLYAFNRIARERGNYNWGLSIHPYPSPLTKTRFWDGKFDKSETAGIVTPMNLSALTDVLTKRDFLDTNGDVRSIGITELGFCSRIGEEAQAAAFAYCYYIIEDNPYIDSLLLNRQHDDKEALKSGLSLGIYNIDYSPKKIADVFKKIDSDDGKEYIQDMLKIIGEDDLQKALDKAR